MRSGWRDSRPSHKRVVRCIHAEDAVGTGLTDEPWTILEPLIGAMLREPTDAGDPGAAVARS
jgi:hypothetical protein